MSVGRKRTPFAERDFGRWQHKALGIDAAALDRARKVHALVAGGATVGERAAAEDRLAAIAAGAGVSAEALTRALRAERSRTA